MRVIILFLTFGIISWGLSSCEDNDDPVWGSGKNAFRIVRSTVFELGEESQREDFSYEGDQLMLITTSGLDDDLTWIAGGRKEISYLGDHIYVREYSDVNGEGALVRDGAARYIVRNGLMLEEISYEIPEEEWVAAGKWVYTYHGSLLTSWKEYRYVDGEEQLAGEGTFTYSDGRLVSSISEYLNESGNPLFSSQISFTYSGNRLSGYTETYLDGEEQTVMAIRAQYQYELQQIVSRSDEFWDVDTDSWIPVDVVSFQYDENNNLIQRGDEEDWMEYEYEAGNGNARFFTMYPESMVYGAPSFKSAVASGKHIPYHMRLLTQIAQ